MRSDSSSSRRKGSVETRGEFEIYISDVVVHPRYTVRTSSQSSISLLKFLVFFSWILSVERECVCVCGDWGDGFWEWKSVENVVFFLKTSRFRIEFELSVWTCSSAWFSKLWFEVLVSLCVYKESKTTPTARYFDREISYYFEIPLVELSLEQQIHFNPNIKLFNNRDTW